MEPQTEIKKFRVRSKSEPGVYRIVEVLSDGKLICNCPAGSFGKKICRHKKVVIKELIKQGVCCKVYL